MKIKDIIKKLDSESTYNLSPEEIYVYLTYRLNELIAAEKFVNLEEIRYRFSETGPGKKRFDSLILDILLNSKLFKNEVLNKKILFKNDYFYNEESNGYKEFLEIKEKLFSKVKEEMESKYFYKKLLKKVAGTTEEIGYSVLESNANSENNFIEVKIEQEEKENMFLLVRYYNTLDWIYPDSWQMWDLIKKSHELKAIPVLIAPRVHGSCFELCKALGFFARATYYFFTDLPMADIKNSLLEENDKYFFEKYSVGKNEHLSSDSFSERFSALDFLLSTTIPDNYNDFSERFEKKTKKIYPMLNNDLKFLIQKPKKPFNGEERHDRIKQLLSMKLGRLNNLSKMIQRNEKLIESLN